MARADSTIRVNIIGDAKSLQKATGQAETAVGGMNKKLVAAGAVIAGAFAVDQVVEFGNTAIKEADRVADAAGRVTASLGPEMSQGLIDRADEFSKFGASEGDMLELEARILNIGTAAGIAKKDLGPFAEEASKMASGLEGITDIEADVWIDKIGKAAATGNTRALQDLGIFLDDAAVNAKALADTGKESVDMLTEQELATARAALVMQLLDDKYGNTIESSEDLEGKQRELNAKFETLTGNIGKALEGPLTDFLTWIIDTAGWLDTTGLNADGLAEDIQQITDAVKVLLTPFARLVDLLRAFDSLTGGTGLQGPEQRSGRTPRGPAGSPGVPNTVNVNVQGGSPEAIEQAVRNAVNTVTRRSGALE